MTQKLPTYLEQYLEEKFKNLGEKLDIMQTSFSGFETRVSRLEHWRTEIMGKVAIISLILVFAVNFLVEWLKQKLHLE